MFGNYNCKESYDNKYQSRPGPPYPANECHEGTIKLGNNGLMYVAVATKGKGGKLSNRWKKLPSNNKSKPKIKTHLSNSNTHKKTCKKSTDTKYQSRPGPPYPANDCALGKRKKGNDGIMYTVVEVSGKRGTMHRWVKTSSAKKSITKSTNSKTCPPGKVLSPKGRCVKDRSGSTKMLVAKKTCPPGKVLSPKGRCVKDRSGSNKMVVAKKTCPPGKVLSPKGRCVKDRSGSNKMVVAKKTCPPGKVLSPKGRCVKDRSGSTKMLVAKKRTSIMGNSCEHRSEKKYQTRPSPPYSANECPEGITIMGNDGEMYQAVSYDTKRGIINRWVKCGKANTSC